MPRRRLKSKQRRREEEYPPIDERKPEQHAELMDYVSGKTDKRPTWIEYPNTDDRYWFGPEILTAEERHSVMDRDDELDPDEDDSTLEPPAVPV